jgi:hypothetical protein
MRTPFDASDPTPDPLAVEAEAVDPHEVYADHLNRI